MVNVKLFEREYAEKYIEFVKDIITKRRGLKFDDNLLYGMLGSNPLVTWEIVCKHPEIPWDYCHLSSNPNITWEIVSNNMNRNWAYTVLSKSANKMVLQLFE